jgi:hypothetical protein
MSETTLQPRLPHDPALRDSVRRLCARPPLAPHLETGAERVLAAWLPRDAHIEQVLLGACLVHQTPQPIIGLGAEQFFYLYHQRLAAAIFDLAQSNTGVNLQTLRAFLNADVIAVPEGYLFFVMAEYLRDGRNKDTGESP